MTRTYLDGAPLDQVNISCAGAKGSAHPAALAGVFIRDGAWPDGRDYWTDAPSSPPVEWQYVVAQEVDEQAEIRGSIFSTSNTSLDTRHDDMSEVRARLILRCPTCERPKRVLRRRLERLLSGVAKYQTPNEPGLWEVDYGLIDAR